MAQDDEIETDDNGASASDIPLASNGPAGSLSMKMPAQPMNPVLQQYFQNKNQMANAQKQANNNEMITGLARAGASLSAGLARSSAPVDQKPFDAMAATDQQPVTDLQNQQKAETADLSNQKSALSNSKDQADQDPNSPQSIAAKNMVKKLYPGKFDDSTLDGLSAADLTDKIYKPLELDEKIQAHKDEMRSKSADRAVAMSGKSDENQNKAYTDLVNHSESARGNPAVQQAMTGILNANKALKIADSGQPVNRQQLRLLADELGKIATGGVPGEHGTESLMPDNLQTRFAKLKEFLSSNPTDADAAQYVKVNSDYLHQMVDVSNDTLHTHYRRLLSGYEDRISDTQKEKYKKEYELNGASQASAGPAGGGQTQDHQSRAAAILAKRDSAKSAGVSNPMGVPNFLQAPSAQPAPLQPQPAQAASDYWQGGAVQPQAPHPMNLPKPPVAHIAPAMHPNRMQTAMHFERGGTVPGQPQVAFNSPVNDTVTAHLTPKEEVLPLSVTQSHTPSMAAYLHMKSKGYK